MINTEKTTAMSFHNRQNRNLLKAQVKFNNMDIAYKSKSKSLRIYITENMKWNVHVKPLN
jgi:hypothetical protein